MNLFAQNLKTAMDNTHCTQTDLHARTGMSKSSISQYLSGNNHPTRSRLELMSMALNVSVDWLLHNGEGEESTRPVPPVRNVKITFVAACRCLQISQDAMRKLLVNGCEFGKAVQGQGSRLNYIIYPGKFREAVGADRFDQFFQVSV